MRKHIVSIWLVLFLAAAVHVDFHLGRPTHFRHSGGSPIHFLLAIPVFAVAAFSVARRWPQQIRSASVRNLALGMVAGQLIEPASEPLIFGGPFLSAWEAPRWELFAEFLAVGIVVYVLTLMVVGRRTRVEARPPG